MTQPFEPLDIKDFSPAFRQQYGPACHQIVELVALMATRGEVDNIILLGRLMEKILNNGMLIVEEMKKGKEKDEWKPGWLIEGRA